MSKRTKRQFVRRVRPRVVVSLKPKGAIMQTIVALGRSWDWDLLDYSLVYGVFPSDPAPTGALTDSLWDTPLVQRLHQEGCAMVRLGKRVNDFDHLLPSVLPDFDAAGRLAARHFIERGFERLAYIGWNAGDLLADSHTFYQAFYDYATKRGVSVDLYDTRTNHQKDEPPDIRFDRRKSEIGRWLKGLVKPLGLLTYSDEMAAQLCVICRHEGINVPEEVAILGIGNTTWCERAPVELSSIALSDEERARKAMVLLRELMNGRLRAAGAIMVPPSGIHQRRSTDILAVNDLAVAKALRFLWEHSRENIGVRDVADEVGLSERQLERRFVQAIGFTVNQKLVRRRLDEVKRLLRTTDLSVVDIAPITGFRSSRHLHHTFHREIGMTPLQFRKGDCF